VDADVPVSLQPLVERRYVREADQGFAEGAWSQMPQKSHRAVAAPGAEHSPNARIAQGGAQLGKPPTIVARQVTMALEDSGVVLNRVAVGDEGKARFE